MPRFKFKNFSDLAFIQSIDKPTLMAPLLAQGGASFAEYGIDPKNLKNTPEDDQRLLRVFTEHGDELPPTLLELLYTLDDLADENGHDRILAEAERQHISLDAIVQRELSPGEFAIAVHLAFPRLIRVCHEKIAYRKIKNYEEYLGKGPKSLSIDAAQAARSKLEEEMAPWFENKGRSRACEIYIFQEDREIKFQITHGRPVTTDGAWTKKLQRSRVAYRPQKHDMVVYETTTRVLRANAQTEGERNLYRTTMGRILFGDPDYFPIGDLYTLESLRTARPSLATVPGIQGVKLTEVQVVVDDGSNFTQISRASDLIAAAAKHGAPNFEKGLITRAAFMVSYTGVKRARKVEVRPPNVAIYDRDRGGEITEAFFKKNKFLILDTE